MSRYVQVNSAPRGPGDARPTALDVVRDEGLQGKLTGSVGVVTGASSGMGPEVARALAATGMTVFCTARDVAKANKALEGIKTEIVEMDNASLVSVRKAASEILAKANGKVNILINNAAIMACPFATTQDGFESQFGVCHLAHFLFFQLLKDALLRAATSQRASRVVSVSSVGHRAGPVNFNDYNYERDPKSYSPWGAYGSAKTANIYLANEIERRYSSKHLHALSLHPGGVRTGLQAHIPQEIIDSWKTDEKISKKMKNAEQGASATVIAALAEEHEGKGGYYLNEDGVKAEMAKEEDRFSVSIEPGYAPHAFNPEGETQLWQDSLAMVGLPQE
ncbi:NAD(P)-binding protein [Acaromyces ingoldii]|uniref:NAD(P)-binding protein n=1 Tax=Acaromyces ingoldii TaxID=215250 RepID=A0A316YLT6_9BASI|nr:NAD(P)-binding protein [Acaromyces ingoldii]PWN89033.1 NAD(P)-binding protein [Acaromyces ingoldii]